MREVTIPGAPKLHLASLVLDFNGTVAGDGTVLPGVGERLQQLAGFLTIFIVTADTHGSAARQCASLPCQLEIIGDIAQDVAKGSFVAARGAHRTAAIGNGRNDILMLREAALGIAIIGGEGAYGGLIGAADIVCRDINDSLDLLLNPARLIATLRN